MARFWRAWTIAASLTASCRRKQRSASKKNCGLNISTCSGTSGALCPRRRCSLRRNTKRGFGSCAHWWPRRRARQPSDARWRRQRPSCEPRKEACTRIAWPLRRAGCRGERHEGPDDRAHRGCTHSATSRAFGERRAARRSVDRGARRAASSCGSSERHSGRRSVGRRACCRSRRASTSS